MEESVDLSITINTKQSKGGDFNLRTIVNLPGGTGKKIKVEILMVFRFENRNERKLAQLIVSYVTS